MIWQLVFRMARICPLRFLRNLIQLPQFGKTFAEQGERAGEKQTTGRRREERAKVMEAVHQEVCAACLLSILHPRKALTKAVLGTSSGNTMRTDFYFRLPECGL